MKSVPCGIAGLAILASGLFGFVSITSAQSDDGFQPELSRALAVAVDYGNDAVFQPDKHDATFDQLGIRPQQTVTITIQFPTELAGAAIVAEPLDGGALSLPEDGL